MAGCLPPVKSIHLEVSQPRSTIYFHCTICSASFAPLIAANYCFVRSLVRSFACLFVCGSSGCCSFLSVYRSTALYGCCTQAFIAPDNSQCTFVCVCVFTLTLTLPLTTVWYKRSTCSPGLQSSANTGWLNGWLAHTQITCSTKVVEWNTHWSTLVLVIVFSYYLRKESRPGAGAATVAYFRRVKSIIIN